MHDITLYGHITVDKIFDGFNEHQTLGAMANMWRTFKHIAPDLDVGLCPTSIGEALIYIDRDSSTRYSNAILDIKTKPPIIKESKISHALYINKLTDVSWLPKLPGIISADVCAGTKVDVNLLQYLDYFFNINMIFGFLTGFLISSFSMIVNDYYDIDVDRINSPNRPLVKGDISLINAKYLAIMFLFLGILSALYISLIHFAIASIFSFVSWYYNFKGKKYGLIGNFLVSLSISIPYIYGGLIHNIYDPLIMVLAGITFLASTGREIIKTIADVDGDKIKGIKSVSIQFGSRNAMLVACGFIIISILVSFIPVCLLYTSDAADE